MTRDLFVGVVCSAVFHGGFFLADRWFAPSPRPAAVADAVQTVEFIMPPVPEEELLQPDAAADGPAEKPEVSLPVAPERIEVVDIAVAIPQPAQILIPDRKIDARMTTIPVTNGGDRRKGRIGGSAVFELSSLDEEPVAKFQAKPVYPFEMHRSGTPGDVLVAFVVDASGVVREAYAVRSNQREFEASAVQAVMKWRFRPGKKDGRAVSTRMQVPIVFSITSD